MKTRRSRSRRANHIAQFQPRLGGARVADRSASCPDRPVAPRGQWVVTFVQPTPSLAGLARQLDETTLVEGTPLCENAPHTAVPGGARLGL